MSSWTHNVIQFASWCRQVICIFNYNAVVVIVVIIVVVVVALLAKLSVKFEVDALRFIVSITSSEKSILLVSCIYFNFTLNLMPSHDRYVNKRIIKCCPNVQLFDFKKIWNYIRLFGYRLLVIIYKLTSFMSNLVTSY